MIKPIDFARAIKNYRRQIRESRNSQVKMINFTKLEYKDYWFRQFIIERGLLTDHPRKQICMYSVFGHRFVIDLKKSDLKIFFTGENIHRDAFKRFEDHALNKRIHLALGFDHLEDPRYMRFPLWLHYMFPPTSNAETIREKCKKLSYPSISTRPEFASLISRHDKGGLRAAIMEQMETIDHVKSAGQFRKNTNDLEAKFSDNKNEYLKLFKYNICPENSDHDGYVTEKLFQAIMAGCIPVYWGSGNDPEPNILNKDAILFWEKNGVNTSTLATISELHQYPSRMKEFSGQPRLLPGAAEEVIGYFERLENKIADLLKDIK